MLFFLICLFVCIFFEKENFCLKSIFYISDNFLFMHIINKDHVHDFVTDFVTVDVL